MRIPVGLWISSWLFTTAAWANTLELGSVIDKVISSHPSVQSQKSLIAGAQSDSATARQQFYPTPSFVVEQVNAEQADSTYRGNALLQTYRLQQPIWTGGRLTAGLEKATAQENLSRESLNDTLQQLALRSIQVWGELYASELKSIAVERSLTTHLRLLDQIRRRVREGASAPVDLVLTQGRLDQVQSQKLVIHAQMRTARSKLSQLTGAIIQEHDTPNEQLIFAPIDLFQLNSGALETAPLLKKLQFQQQIQEAEIKERRSELKPEVFIRAEHQRGSYDSASMNSGGVNRIYLGITSRFGAGFSNVTHLDALQKRLEASHSEFESSKRNVLEQIGAEWELLESLIVRLPRLQMSLRANRATAEAWDRQYLAGRKSWMEVMNTTRELMQAELELADAKASLAQVKWRLSVLSQGLAKTLEVNSKGPMQRSQGAPQ